MRTNVEEAPRPIGEGACAHENPFLEVRHIVKNFGGVRALDGVDLAVWPGKVLCLAGEAERSEERRVGKECRSRWSPYH